MNAHRGVSCNNCQKHDFNGKRYKCLRCFDYDLCGECYDTAAVSERHTIDHPVQCILTNADFALYYGGENLQTVGQIQSYTCPLCGKMGLTENTLKNHIMEHPDEEKLMSVLCPMCCNIPGNDNEMSQDISTHLMLEHSSDLRELALLFDEPERPRRTRILNSASRSTAASTNANTNRSRISHSQNSTSGRVTLPLDDQRFPNLLMLLLDRAEMRSARRNIQAARAQPDGSRTANTRRRTADHVIADRLSLVPELDHATNLNLLPVQQEPFLQFQSGLIVETSNNSGELLLPVIPERRKSEGTVTTSSATETRAQTSSIQEQETHQFLLPSLICEKEKEGQASRKQRAERGMFVRDLLLSSIVDVNVPVIKLDQDKISSKDKEKENSESSIKHNNDNLSKDCVLS